MKRSAVKSVAAKTETRASKCRATPKIKPMTERSTSPYPSVLTRAQSARHAAQLPSLTRLHVALAAMGPENAFGERNSVQQNAMHTCVESAAKVEQSEVQDAKRCNCNVDDTTTTEEEH